MKKTAKKKAKKHTRFTKHDDAVSKPDVKALIDELIQLWPDLPRDARSRRLEELRAKDCTRRGLADALKISETTVRGYLPKKDAGAEGVGRTSMQGPKVAPVYPESVSVAISPPGQASISVEPNASAGQLERKYDLFDLDEPTRSSIERIANAILDFVRSKDGVPETSTPANQVPVLLEATQKYLESHGARYPRPFWSPLRGDPVPIFLQTKPARLADSTQSDLDYRTQWLGAFLRTVSPKSMVRELAIARAASLARRQKK